LDAQILVTGKITKLNENRIDECQCKLLILSYFNSFSHLLHLMEIKIQ
jgi:hypothetical protein